MARVPEIVERLENWGRWARQSEAGALGYPKQSPFARLAPSGGRSGGWVDVRSLEASETDDAIKSMRFTQSHLYMVVLLTYAKGLPRHKVALQMGRAESTVSQNLGNADRAIQRWLEDRAAVKAQLAKDSKKSLST